MRNQLEQARSFASQIVAQLDVAGGLAQVGVVDFNGAARTLTGLSSDPTAISEAIANYGPATGGTHVNAGLNTAADMLGQWNGSPPVKVIMLLCDGAQSSSYGGIPSAIETAQTVKDMGIAIFAVGFGGASASTMDALNLN